MSGTTEYKCPTCGGTLAFDSVSQKLKCPYCDSQFDIDQFETPEHAQGGDTGQQAAGTESQPGTGGMNWNVEPGSEWAEGEQAGMNIYSCQSCGGEIVCEETTASATCPYCGSPVVMKSRLSGVLKPDCIIPFKLDKKAAKEALKKHVNSKKLVPALFKSENHINEIKGVYVPFWLFDASVAANITYRGEKTRHWSDSQYEYIEHNYYNIYRAGSVAFDNVPVDGSEKMPDDLMESIEPFDFRDAVDFKTAYLAGYMADKYDVDAQASIENANKRIIRSAEETFRETIQGYGMVTTESTYIDLQNGTAKYALYPVWLLNTKWQGNTYTFAMNGQSGKFVGDLPLDKGAFWRKFGLFTGIFGAAASAFAVLIDYLFI